MAQSRPTILFLASWYPVPNNKSHGIFIRNHALALSRFCNVIVAYAYASPGTKNTQLSKNKVNDHFEEWLVSYKKTGSAVPLLSDLLKYYRFINANRRLVKELSAQKINIKAIQVNTIFPAAAALFLFRKQWPVPYALLEHWTGYLSEDGNYKGFLIKYYTKKAVAGAKKIFYVSQKQKEAMEQHGLKGTYELIYNVVDTSVFNTSGHAKPAKPLLLHVSALDDAQKNISGILTVIAALQKRHLNFDFLFIGGNSQLVDQYSRRVHELGLKNVQFVGNKTQVEIAGYMQKAAALVLFSNYENMPVVVLEALASGLPVISTRTGYLDFMISPEFGRLVDLNSEVQLLNALQDLLQGGLNFDPEKMSAYIASHASYEVVGKELYNNYKAWLDS